MSDMSCIYKEALLEEKDMLLEDILEGNALDVLLNLLTGPKSAREISRDLKVPVLSITLYLKRLLKTELVKEEQTTVLDGKIEKIYSLVAKDVDLLNNLKNSNTGKNVDLSAEHFASLIRKTIKNINNYKEKTHKIKAYFIKTDDDSMKAFKTELEALFEKYQELEDENATETYGFISVLAPYNTDEK